MGLATEEIQNNSSIGERKLWCWIFLCAVQACKKGVPGSMDYFSSQQFLTVCAFLDLNPEWIRKQALSDKPLVGVEVNQIYLIDPNPQYRIDKRARRAKSRLEESSNKGWISGPGVILESGVQDYAN
jgi:hypothetical protein